MYRIEQRVMLFTRGMCNPDLKVKLDQIMMVVKATGLNHLYIVFDDFNLLAYESQFLVNKVEES